MAAVTASTSESVTTMTAAVVATFLKAVLTVDGGAGCGGLLSVG